MTGLLGKFNDGGPVFTYTIFLLLIVILALFAKGLTDKGDNKKTTDLIASFGWFALAWGFLGRTFGLIKAFDMVGAAGELTPALLAEGLKMALIDPLFGLIAFLFARAGIIVLISLRKQNKTDLKKSKAVLEYSVRATPLIIDNRHFTIVSLHDISDKKRLENLQRVFIREL